MATQTYQRKQYNRKPASPYQQLMAAIERMQESRKEGADLRVIAIGKVLATCQPVYFVPSQKVPGMWHAVIQTKEGGLACDCYYSKEQHKVCVHRACVYEHLKAQPAQPGKINPASSPRGDAAAPAPTASVVSAAPAPPQQTQTPPAQPVPASVAVSSGPSVADRWEAYQDSRRNGDWE
jgi:hypothetical protein